MAKITLGTRPKSFRKTITVPLPEGGQGSVVVDYIYRTRKEFGAFVDELMSDTERKAAATSDATPEAFSVARLQQNNVDTNAGYIMAIATGWDLPSDFTLANVTQLCDELPGVAIAIIDAYRAACTEGRLGN